MNAFHRLSRFGSTVKERVWPVWRSAKRQFERVLQRLWQWLKRRRRPVLVVIVGGPLLYLGLRWYGPQVWRAYRADRDSFTPFFTPIAALLAGLAALGQWRTARLRHEEQTNADRQRRITESYSKAVTQLASDKLEERLGGVYTLESISKESPADYWTVMETLTAFVRERSRRNEAERLQNFEQRIAKSAYFLWREAGKPDGRAEEFWAQAVKHDEVGEPPATDIAAILTVIERRSEPSREREGANAWFLDLRGAFLKQANLGGLHLERANLNGAHLERAELGGAYLAGAILSGAYLAGADFRAHLAGANLDGAYLEGTGLHLKGADLRHAYLEGADLRGAYFEGANLGGAHLAGANLRGATGLSPAQVAEAYGDAATRLPDRIPRPKWWPTPDVLSLPV
jgi:Pentapeptide repeats (8 copies)/Protein of unknown function (DUF2934)